MASPPARLQQSILAVLAAAKASDVRLNRTALFKFVYLLDCLHAEGHHGETASEANWYFHHFGPFAVDLADGLDVLAGRGMIQSRDDSFQGKDFTQYWLGEFPAGPSLESIGLNSSQAMRFSQWLRSFAGDMSKLLDYVYFDTLPMANATPGRKLDFSELSQLATMSARRHHVHIQDHAKIFRVLQLQDQMKQKFLAKPAKNLAESHRPIYDSVYYDAMAILDGEQGQDEPIEFSAAI